MTRFILQWCGIATATSLWAILISTESVREDSRYFTDAGAAFNNYDAEKYEQEEIIAVRLEMLQAQKVARTSSPPDPALRQSHIRNAQDAAEVRAQRLQTSDFPTSSLTPANNQTSILAVEPIQRVKRLELSLQGDYSCKLYGAPGRLPPGKELRLIWLDLLEAWQQEEVAQIGVCELSSSPSTGSPYFAPVSSYFNPLDSLWKHSELRPGRPQEWIEVTHCGRTFHTYMQFVDSSMWYYGAPGSGISINLGNTLFLGVFDADEWENNDVKSNAISILRNYDSVQVFHAEHYSTEWRHEIIFHGNEHEPLDYSTPGIKCGRHPYLFACTPDHPPFRYLSHTCQRDYSPKVSAKVPLQQCSPLP